MPEGKFKTTFKKKYNVYIVTYHNPSIQTTGSLVIQKSSFNIQPIVDIFIYN